MPVVRVHAKKHQIKGHKKKKINVNLELAVPEGFEVANVNDGIENKFKITYVGDENKGKSGYAGGAAHVLFSDTASFDQDGDAPSGNSQRGAQSSKRVRDDPASRAAIRPMSSQGGIQSCVEVDKTSPGRIQRPNDDPCGGQATVQGMPPPMTPLTANRDSQVQSQFQQAMRGIGLPGAQPLTGRDAGIAQNQFSNYQMPLQSGFNQFDNCPQFQPQPNNGFQQAGLGPPQPNNGFQQAGLGPTSDQWNMPNAGNQNINNGTSYLPFNYAWDRCTDTVAVTGKPKPLPPPPPPCPPPPPPAPCDDTKVNFNSSMSVSRSVPIMTSDAGVMSQPFPQPCPDPQGPNQPPDDIFNKMVNTVGVQGAYNPSALDAANWLVPDESKVEFTYSQLKPWGYDPLTGEMAQPVQPQNPCGEPFNVTTPPNPCGDDPVQIKPANEMRCLKALEEERKRLNAGYSNGNGQTMFGPQTGVEFTGQPFSPCDLTRMRPISGPNNPPPSQSRCAGMPRRPCPPEIDQVAIGQEIRPQLGQPSCRKRPLQNCQPTDQSNISVVVQPQSEMQNECDDLQKRSFCQTWGDVAFFFYLWLFCVAASQLFKMYLSSTCNACQSQ